MPEWIVGLIGVLVGFFLTTIKDWWSSRQISKKKAYYLAVRVVCVLDRFIDKCVYACEDEFVDNEQQPYMACGPIPEAPEFPEDIDWKSIDPDLSYEILNLPNKIVFAKQSIATVSQFDTPPYTDTNEKVKYEITTLGALACKLSSELRKKYKIPFRGSSPWTHDFEPCIHLCDKKNNIEKSLKKRDIIPAGWGDPEEVKKK